MFGLRPEVMVTPVAGPPPKDRLTPCAARLYGMFVVVLPTVGAAGASTMMSTCLVDVFEEVPVPWYWKLSAEQSAPLWV